MADITKDSFNEANDFTKVVFQRGRDLMDFELNEFQDILRVFSARLGQVGVGLWQAAASISYPYSSDNGLEVVVSPTSTPNEVQINAGTFIVDGIVQDYTVPTTLVLPAPAGTIQYDIVYISVTESEVADPNAVPQIGPTTVRRQLATTVLTYRTASLPFDPSFPVNPAAWLWQGQTRYYPIAVVTRPALTAVVTAADIFDLRRQTPSRTLAEAARVADFKLEALITPSLETPIRNVNGIDNQLIVDINKNNSASLVALNDVMTVRSRQQSGSAQTMATLTRYASTTTGVAGRLALGTNYALYGSAVLRFQDDNVVNTGYPAPVTNKFVQFSSVANGASVLRIGEQGAVVQNAVTYGASTILAANNMLKAINGRLHVTIGDGTTSFGDFSGTAAIEDALQFFADAITAGATFTSLELDVKRGTYIVSAAGSINIAASTKVTITGDNPETTVIQVPTTVSGGFSVGTGATLTLKNLKMTGASATISLLGVGAGTLITENCYIFADGFGLVVNGATSIKCRRTWFKAVTGVANIPLVQLRLGAGINVAEYLFEDCTFDTQGQVNVPVVRVQGTGSYTTDSSIESIVFRGCDAIFGGATLSGGSTAWNPSCVNTGLIDFAANNANKEGTASWTRVDSITIENCRIAVLASATATCLTALRLTMNPTGDFSGSLFSAGFIYLGNLTINGLQVRLAAGASPGSDVSPVIIGMYQTDMDISDVVIENATTTSPGLHSGKLPYDAYTYMTADGTVAAAPNTGAGAPNAVAGYESSLVFIANRWLPTRFYALVQADLRLGRQAIARINNLKIFGIERGSDSIHTASGELTIVAQDTVMDLANVFIDNYYDTSPTTRSLTPEHRVRLRPISYGSSGTTPTRPTITLRDSRLNGFAALQGAIAAGTITNGGTSYTDGFYAGIPLTGGAGSGATANITVAGGIVTNVVIARAGSGYAAANVLSATLPAGSSFTYTVSAVTSGSAWLSGVAFVTHTAALQATSSTVTSAYIKIDPEQSLVSAGAHVTLQSVTIEGYRTFVVAQSPAIGCVRSDGLTLLRIHKCFINRTGDGIRVQVPLAITAYPDSVSIEDCSVVNTNNGIVYDGGDGPGNSVIISNNYVALNSVNPALLFANSTSQYGGRTVINGNTFNSQNASNIYALFLCDTWPSNYVLPTITMVGNSCAYGSAAGFIKINNAPTPTGTFPTNGHVWKSGHTSNALCTGLETIDTPYNNGNGELYYIDGKYMVHNNARFKVGP